MRAENAIQLIEVEGLDKVFTATGLPCRLLRRRGGMGGEKDDGNVI